MAANNNNSQSNSTHLDFLDFELEIGSGAGRDYPVSVVHSPAGEGHETMRFPFDELELKNNLQALQIALLRSGGKRRRILSSEEQSVQNFGKRLFDSLFTGEVQSLYQVSQVKALQHGKGLRLKLRIHSPELAVLPWEFLYDTRQAEYLSLSRATPVIRYMELPQPIQPLTVTPPLRVLGMIASPNDLPPLDVYREKQRIEEAIKELIEEGLMHLSWMAGQTWRDLQHSMRGGPWHVLHFIGHGGFDHITDEGLIALSDENGLTNYLTATQLGRLLADHRFLRLVILNACEGARGSERDVFSSTSAILMRRGIPAVLAMQHEITDRAAIEFTRAFYEAVADGIPVDAAVAEARKSISLSILNTMEWGTPVLHMRSPDGVLFIVQQQRQEGKKRERIDRLKEADLTREGRGKIPPQSLNRLLKWWWIVVLALIIGFFAVFGRFWQTSKSRIIERREPGVYLTANGHEGERLTKEKIIVVKMDESSGKSLEDISDRPLNISDVLGLCLLRDVSKQRPITWDDVGSCE